MYASTLLQVAFLRRSYTPYCPNHAGGRQCLSYARTRGGRHSLRRFLTLPIVRASLSNGQRGRRTLTATMTPERLMAPDDLAPVRKNVSIKNSRPLALWALSSCWQVPYKKDAPLLFFSTHPLRRQIEKAERISCFERSPRGNTGLIKVGGPPTRVRTARPHEVVTPR